MVNEFKMNTIDKLTAVGMSVFYATVILVKKVLAYIFYPIVYVTSYKWAGEPFEREDGYKFPEELQGNDPITLIRWFLSLFFGRSKPYGHEWYYMGYYNCDCPTAGYFKRLWVSYLWSTRNSMYNVNYWYLSNMSKVTSYEKSFGPAVYDHKLRTRKGDDGYQLVWYKTEKGQSRYLFSLAKKPFNKLDITSYFGWNVSDNGRFTMALKVKLIKD